MAQPFRQSIVPRRFFCYAWVPALLATFVSQACAQQTALPPADAPTLEYQVKAAFLLNFTKFIEWPAHESGGADAPFTVCLLGDDTFAPILSQMMEGETVSGRKIVVQRDRREVPKGCQMLYVGRSEKDLAEILGGGERGVLTVGESESFLHAGGIIAFVMENRRVRFMVNLTAARNASLNISSRLLTVAKGVEK